MFASDAVELVRERLARLATEDRRAWTGPAQTQRLLELRQLQESLDAEVVRCVGDWDAAAAWAESPGLGPKSMARVERAHDASLGGAARGVGSAGGRAPRPPHGRRPRGPLRGPRAGAG